MPRRNRGRRRVFDMGAHEIAEAVWNVELPQIGRAIQDYLTADSTTLTVRTTTGTSSSDSITITGDPPPFDGRTPEGWRLGIAPNTQPFRRGGPEFPALDPPDTFEYNPIDLGEGAFIGALRQHNPLDSLVNPEGQCAKLAFVREVEDGNKEVSVMVTLPPLKKADEELLKYLDRAFAAVIHTLLIPVPVDRSRRSIIIEEEQDADTAEAQSSERQEG